MRFVSIFCLLFCINFYSQSSFLSTIDSLDTSVELEYSFVKKYFDIDTLYKRDSGTNFYLQSKFFNKSNKSSTIILGEDNGVGSMAYLISFTNDGKLIDKAKIMEAFDNDDLDAGDFDIFYELEDTLVTVKYRIETPTEDNDIIKRKIDKYISIDESGYFFELSTKNKSKERLLPEASTKKLTKADLQNFSKDELLIIRNEIFASYGYKFKSKKLAYYFNNIKSYNPIFDDVLNKLTSLEKENIELIKEVEENVFLIKTNK